MFNESREGMFPTWLLWVIGPVTVLAAALIIFAVVLGIRAGQRQIEIQRRQEVGIALQRAIDYQAEGRLQDAVSEYRQALMLDPGNETALAGIQSIIDQANIQGVDAEDIASGEEEVPLSDLEAPPGSPTAGEAGAAGPTATSMLTTSAANALTPTPDLSSPDEQLYQQAAAVYQSGDWLEAADLLVQLQEQAPNLRSARVEEMLYNCYVNLAAERDQAGDLEEAVAYVDKALELRPNAASLRQARTMAANYVEALELQDSDPARTVELLEEIYVADSTYRDVDDRLLDALLAYGDQLALKKQWCMAEEQYSAAIAIEVTPGSIARRDDFRSRCAQLEELRALDGATPTPTRAVVAIATATAAASAPTATVVPDGTDAADVDDGAGTESDADESPDSTPTPTNEESTGATAGPISGRIVYSALDPVNGRNLIYSRPAAGGQASILVQDAQQPAFRPDGQRLVFRNLDDRSRGISTLDPGSDLELGFTDFSEDGYPSWNAQGNLIAFASNREGDRRWRIYVLWAEVGNEATGMGFGQAPDWHPSTDLMAYQGCDETGNNCGIRTMTGDGANPAALTTVAADTRPDWAPDGSFVAFMSEGRHGNAEIYRVDAASGQVSRLTESGSMDVLPVVSPDSAWVAFMSNRSGSWAVWAVPSSGGEAQQLFPIEGGIGAWQEQSMQWIN